MSFGNPNFLYALPVVLIPIIIHFLKLYKTTTLYYSRVEDIKQLKKDQKKLKRLKDWLTLLLRTLAILLLVLAFAQPKFSSDSANTIGQNQTLHLVIDNSASNWLNDNEGLENAKSEAIKILDDFPEQQTVNVSTLNDSYTNLVINEAIEKINSIELTTEFKPFVLNTDSTENIVAFSDFQSAQWSKATVTNGYFNQSTLPTENLLIDTAYFLNSKERVGEKMLIAQLTRKGNAPDKVVYEVLRDDQSVVNKIIEFGNLTTVLDTLFVEHNSEDYSNITLNIEDPAGLQSDNRYFLTLEPTQKEKIFIYGSKVNERVFSKLLENDAEYESEFLIQGQDNFSNKPYSDILIVAGINSIDANLLAELNRLQGVGGTCLFFPGNSIDASVNDYLLRFDFLLETQNSDKNQLLAFRFTHPYFKSVFSNIPKDPSLPFVNNGYVVTGGAQFEELIQGAYGSLATYKKSGDFNLVVSGIQFPSTANNSNFFKHALFVPFTLKALELHQSKSNALEVMGKRLYSNSLQEESASISNAKGVLAELPWQKQFGKSFLNIDGIPFSAGFYTVQTSGKNYSFALNYNRTESNLQYMNTDDLKVNGFTELNKDELYENQGLEGHSSNDSYLFFGLMFLCLLLESFVNKFLTHGGKAL